jgi:hypothetical protein
MSPNWRNDRYLLIDADASHPCRKKVMPAPRGGLTACGARDCRT